MLFEMVDALLCHPGRLESLPYLSLEPVLRRGHGSVYAALDKGRIDAAVLVGVLAEVVARSAGPVFALDCSQWPRPDAPTSPERTLNYDAGKDVGGGGGVVTPGWWFQWLAATGTSGSSWASPVSVERVPAGENHNVVAIGQIEALLQHLRADGVSGAGAGGQVPIVCADGDYSPVYLGGRFTGEQVQIVVRLRKDAVMLADPPPREPGTIGRPRVHGPRMKLSDPGTWHDPDQYLAVPARDGHAAVSVSVWHEMHPRPSESPALREPGYQLGHARPVTRGSVVWVCSADPAYPPMWLFWTGPEGSFDLDRVWRAYLRRYDIEHLFRFLKQYLAWTRPRVHGPEQALRWSQLVAVAYVHLDLGRELVTDQRLPWERGGTPSPLRVKRGFRRLHPQLGTPANPPKPSQPGPGRPPGRTSTPATRHRIIRPAAKT
ncbi:transposase [Amycolatopsis anabasis]|uniref:transposase n=1 Tax=Amycolatopsis anabasis TaxID=1840409 RepID=UPI00131DF581|nr:transposase [Amycolatopsis anabasis]